MNEKNLQQILENYVNNFEDFNSKIPGKPTEYEKWEIAGEFKNKMNLALKTTDENLPTELYKIKKITSDFIDSYTQPFYGLVQFAKKDPKTVRRMFQELYEDDGGDLGVRQKRIENFLNESHQLREQYTPNSYLYKDDFHSVTSYLFLYDPEHNYAYKPKNAKIFAKYIEFFDDFGAGDCVKLKNYYRMCDQLAETIEKQKLLAGMEIVRDKAAGKEIYKDKSGHIQVVDIIYCASTYNLFEGATLNPLALKEWKIFLEKQAEAKVRLEKLKREREKKKKLDEAIGETEKIFCVGEKIYYKSFGKGAPVQSGTIVKNENGVIEIGFEDGNKKSAGFLNVVVNGYIWPQDEQEAAGLASSIELLKNRSMIKTNLETAEREFAPYNDYI